MKKLILAVMLSVLLVSAGAVMAATSGIPNVPAGAAVSYWQTSAAGDVTLLVVQNVTPIAISVHWSFYDRDSVHVFDIECPLTPFDAQGWSMVAGAGAAVNVTPYSWAAAWPGIACAVPQTFPIAAIGGLQHGYVVAAVNRIDANAGTVALLYPNEVPLAGLFPPLGNNDGNPLNDPSIANLTAVLPNAIFMHTALLGPSGAYAFTGAGLQGFMNMSGLQAENVASVAASTPAGVGWVNQFGANTFCPASNVDWDNSASFQAGAVPMQDFIGVEIHAPELYITDNAILGGITAGFPIAPNVCHRWGRQRAMGIGTAGEITVPLNKGYWVRYNNAPGFTDTTLITIAPASNANVLNPARVIADNRTLTIPIYDDQENIISTTIITPPEVGLSPFLSATNAPIAGNFSINHSFYQAGYGKMFIGAPIFGYAFTVVGGTRADMYALVPDNVAVNVVNLGYPDGAVVSDVRLIGF